MKINVIDESDRQNTLQYIKGYKIGRDRMVTCIVEAHQSGHNLKSIYKVIKEIYRKEVKDAGINH